MSNKIVLQDAFKRYTYDDDRVLAPGETVRHFRERLSALDGDFLVETKRADRGRLDIPVFVSRCGEDAYRVTGSRRFWGKGGSPEQAEASAVMELAERVSYHGFLGRRSPFVTATLHEVREHALPPGTILSCAGPPAVGASRLESFFADVPLRWVRGYSLTRGQAVLLPIDWFHEIHNGNGAAAGNAMEEALCHGICEVVERHVASEVSWNRLPAGRIDLRSVTLPAARELIGKYEANGIQLVVSDFSMDTGIPTVAVLAHDPATFPERSEIVWIAGTSPAPQKALVRALAEVAQVAGDFDTAFRRTAGALPGLKGIDEAAHVVHAPTVVEISQLPDISDDNMKVEVENGVSALAGIGMEVLAVDITHPALEIPACFVIVPGSHYARKTRDASPEFYLAKIIAEKCDTPEAVRLLEKMSASIPGNRDAVFFLGRARQRAGDAAGALSSFEASERLPAGPGGAENFRHAVNLRIGSCLMAVGRYAEALDRLAVAGSLEPDDTEAATMIGHCHMAMGEHEKAVDSFLEAAERGPEPARGITYANVAAIFQEMGDHRQAARYAAMAVTYDANIFRNLAGHYRARGDRARSNFFVRLEMLSESGPDR